MSNISPQESFAIFIADLMEDARRAYKDGFPRDGYELIEDAFEYLKTFLYQDYSLEEENDANIGVQDLSIRYNSEST